MTGVVAASAYDLRPIVPLTSAPSSMTSALLFRSPSITAVDPINSSSVTSLPLKLPESSALLALI